MAEDATAAKPKSVSRLGPLCSHHQPLLSADPRTTPNALPPLRRHHPREEPGALAAHAGIRAGGGKQSSSLPRPSRSIPISAVMEYRGISGSLRLDAGGLDHLAPFLGFRGDEPAEVRRRARKRRAAEVVQTRLHRGIS